MMNTTHFQTIESSDSVNQRYLYIVLTRTDTNIARFIRVITRKPYSHASIAMDISLQQLFSFCRNYPAIPLPATFNEELIGQGTFGRFDDIPCEIYEIPVTEEQYRHCMEQIGHFLACRKEYSYSLTGLCSVLLQIERELRNKFVCSQFVAYMLQECDVSLEKPASLYSPEDLRHLPAAKLIYRGELNHYYTQMASENRNWIRSVV